MYNGRKLRHENGRQTAIKKKTVSFRKANAWAHEKKIARKTFGAEKFSTGVREFHPRAASLVTSNVEFRPGLIGNTFKNINHSTTY